jgi:hypothetical protein
MPTGLRLINQNITKFCSFVGKNIFLYSEERHDLYSSLKYYTRGEITKNKLGLAWGTYGEEERYIRVYGGGNLMERDHLSEVSVDGIIIIKMISKKSYRSWTG